jgi:hypothetical protein
MAALAAWLAREVRLLSLQAAPSEPAAWFAWLAAAGPPVFFYSFHVYTEVPSALALALALRLLLAAPLDPRGRRGRARSLRRCPGCTSR